MCLALRHLSRVAELPSIYRYRSPRSLRIHTTLQMLTPTPGFSGDRFFLHTGRSIPYLYKRNEYGDIQEPSLDLRVDAAVALLRILRDDRLLDSIGDDLGNEHNRLSKKGSH